MLRRRRFLASSSAVLAMAVLVLVAGCSKGNPKGDDHDHHHHHGDHPTAGPRGGLLIEWGDEVYHVELIFDRSKQQATAYILDKSAKLPEAVAAKLVVLTISDPPTVIPMASSPQEGDPAGKSSRFIATHAALGGDKKLAGRVNSVIGDDAFDGKFDEAAKPKGDEHGHEGHGNEEHADKDHAEKEHAADKDGN